MWFVILCSLVASEEVITRTFYTVKLITVSFSFSSPSCDSLALIFVWNYWVPKYKIKSTLFSLQEKTQQSVSMKSRYWIASGISNIETSWFICSLKNVFAMRWLYKATRSKIHYREIYIRYESVSEKLNEITKWKPENFHASDELIVSKKRKLSSVRSILKPCIS